MTDPTEPGTPDVLADPAMDPALSPNRPGQGVRRVNNLPLLIVGAAMLVFVGVIAYVAVGRAAPDGGTDRDERVESARDIASELTRSYEAGEVPATGPGAPAPGYASDSPIAQQAGPVPAGFPAPPPPPPGRSADLQPPRSASGEPAQGAVGSTGTQPGELETLRLQMFKGALGAQTTVDVARATSATSEGQAVARGSHVTAQSGGAAGYVEQLRELQQAGLLPTGEGQPTPARDGYAQFEPDPEADRWKLGREVRAPGSPYELRAGAVLPATLVTGINSDLPGQITALVAQDVRDTARGEHVLIPQGSRLVGTYGAHIAFGQERVLVAWQRIVFPDGKALDIGAMPGADAAGYAGFEDQVDNHYFRLFASALLMSGITAGISISQDSVRDPNGRLTMSGAMTEALGQQLGQVSEELIRRQMNVAPTIEIRPGYRFNVQVTKDLTFNAPYRAYDYERSISAGARTFGLTP